MYFRDAPTANSTTDADVDAADGPADAADGPADADAGTDPTADVSDGADAADKTADPAADGTVSEADWELPSDVLLHRLGELDNATIAQTPRWTPRSRRSRLGG